MDQLRLFLGFRNIEDIENNLHTTSQSTFQLSSRDIEKILELGETEKIKIKKKFNATKNN